MALYRDGRIRIRSWPTLAGETQEMDAWRQTPPCLVEQGTLNPLLPTEHTTRKWGAAQGGDREIRRSALAIDAGGRSLIYAFGDWVTATLLAEALALAGAQDAAELDINWSYTKFYFIEHPEGAPPRIGSTIIEKAEYSPSNYISKPSHRDFFYLTRKP